MQTQGVVVEVTSIYTDTVGVLERRHASKGQAGIELTIHALRQDPCGPVVYSVRYSVSVNLASGWSRSRCTAGSPASLSEAYAEADRQWVPMLRWLRHVGPLAGVVAC
jgi:hypothetical protein